MKKKHVLLAVAGLLIALAPAARADLVGHWTFDDTLADATANANDGTFQGEAETSPTYSTDVPANIGTGKSIDFQTFLIGENVKTEAVKVLNSASLQFDQAFTVSFWVKGTAAELNGYIMGKGISWSNDREYGFDVRGNGTSHNFFSLNSLIDGEGPIVNMWGDAFDTGDQGWVLATHVTENRGEDVERDMYINGAYVSTYNNGQPAQPDLNGSTDFWMGGRNISDGISGLLDEVMIWDEALSAGAIAELYSPTPEFDPDLNGDDTYDDLDMQLLLSNYVAGDTNVLEPPYSQADLEVLLGVFGSDAPGSGTTVPEPTSILLGAFGLLGLALLRRRK